MTELLANMIGKKIDLYCGGGSSLRGEVVKVVDGVLHLRDSEQRMTFVNIDKIHVLWEAREDEHRAGFVSATSEK